MQAGCSQPHPLLPTRSGEESPRDQARWGKPQEKVEGGFCKENKSCGMLVSLRTWRKKESLKGNAETWHFSLPPSAEFPSVRDFQPHKKDIK